jgi:hypothetical protein
MTSTKSWAAWAALAGLLTAGSTATAAAGETPPSSAADAVTECLVEHGYPPLAAGSALVPPPGSVLVPAAGGPTAPSAVTSTTLPPLPAGVMPAGVPTLPTGTTAAGTTTPLDDGAALQCGALIIHNTVYMVVATVTNTTTTVAAPITAAAGSISTTNNAPATAVAAPLATATAAPGSPAGTAAIGRPLRVRRTTRGASSRHATRRHVRRLAHVWLVRGAAAR